jgi:pimeloyl-ACP methyl ester carboxylesterase
MTMLRTPLGTINVSDRAGEDPAIVMMHGFPDDSRIYDRLSPLLSEHRVVTFDFVGYGGSERIDATATIDRGRELATVLDELDLDDVMLVAHDASGPVAIDYAVDVPDRVHGIVLLDVLYGHAPSLRLPSMIRLFADPESKPLADEMAADPNQLLWLLNLTGRQLGLGAELAPDGIEAVSILPQFFGDAGGPDALNAVRAWTARLFADLMSQDQRIAASELSRLAVPVTVAAGANDSCLGPALAEHLGGLFSDATVHTIADASHWPQWDRPDEVAAIIRAAIERAPRRPQPRL